MVVRSDCLIRSLPFVYCCCRCRSIRVTASNGFDSSDHYLAFVVICFVMHALYDAYYIATTCLLSIKWHTQTKRQILPILRIPRNSLLCWYDNHCYCACFVWTPTMNSCITVTKNPIPTITRKPSWVVESVYFLSIGEAQAEMGPDLGSFCSFLSPRNQSPNTQPKKISAHQAARSQWCWAHYFVQQRCTKANNVRFGP